MYRPPIGREEVHKENFVRAMTGFDPPEADFLRIRHPDNFEDFLRRLGVWDAMLRSRESPWFTTDTLLNAVLTQPRERDQEVELLQDDPLVDTFVAYGPYPSESYLRVPFERRMRTELHQAPTATGIVVGPDLSIGANKRYAVRGISVDMTPHSIPNHPELRMVHPDVRIQFDAPYRRQVA